MKKNITSKQFSELSEKGKKKLKKWYEDKNDEYNYEWNHTLDCPMYFPNIGQMIEFLDENYSVNIDNDHKMGYKVHLTNRWSMDDEKLHEFNKHSDELCDSLWEAVKEILEK